MAGKREISREWSLPSPCGEGFLSNRFVLYPGVRTPADPTWRRVMSNGQSIVIKGDISGSEDLVIAGRVEGSITLNGRVLTLASGSHVVGEIAAGTVVVSGKVDGKVEAKERLDIKSTAVVDGTLSSAKLIVADGSQITAKVAMPARDGKAKLAAVAGA
jgi:cytoskeletal protein CcmA (bactofilin family)